MSDELRDRIVGVMRKHKLSDPGGGTAAGAWCKCSCGTVETTSSRDHAGLLAQRHQAQAVIDEFGLQVVEVDRMELTDGTVASCQIVGEWEKQ